MTTMSHRTSYCLTREQLRQIANNELTSSELSEIEQHVTDCRHCRELFGSMEKDRLWQEEVLPVLTDAYPPVDLSDDASEAFDNDSILKLLGPTDDPHMLGRIGSYEIVGIIGRGGMGIVFKAFDAALDRFVAIKMLLPHLAVSGAARKRFSREGQAAAAVIDDQVVPIYGVDQWQGVPYLVMQCSSGMSLQKRIHDQGPLDLKEILRIALQTARGLAAAHAQGLVHRDVKPSNILLDGTVDRAALTDFGLARAVDDASMTRSGVVAGTPQYMSPEQARGEAVDQRSDLFSLGSVMYAMCTGHPPFRAETSLAVLRLISDKQTRPIQELNPDLPDWLGAIIEKLMSKERASRFDSAHEVAELLEGCLAHIQHPATVPLPETASQVSGFHTPGQSSDQKLLTQPVKRGAGRGKRLILPAAIAFGILFAGIAIVIELNKGTLTIKSEVDDVKVRIMQGDELVERLTVTRDGVSVRIAAGRYVAEIDGESDGILVQDGAVILQRGGRGIVTIIEKRKSAPPKGAADFRADGKPSVQPRSAGYAAPAKQIATPLEAMLGESIIASEDTAILQGVGLVTGLDETGGDPPPSAYRTLLLENIVRHGVSPKKADTTLSSPSTAMVVVLATLSPKQAVRETFDVEVRLPSTSKATSLAGGRLMETRLTSYRFVASRGMQKGAEYALASGPVVTLTTSEANGASPSKVKRSGWVLKGARWVRQHRPKQNPGSQPQREVWAMDSDGRNARKVADFADFAIINSPEVSPDGHLVAVDGWKSDQNLRDARVLIVDVRSGETKNLCRGAMPTWSPDGKWISFCKYGDERGVYIRSLDGAVERLLDRNGWGIQWSPDGLKAAYARGGKLVVHNFVSDTERVVEPADWDYTYIYWNATWSPDSDQLCFKAKHEDGHSEFAIVNVSGDMAAVRRRIKADGYNEDIAWRPDGMRILVPRKPLHGARAQICEFSPHGSASPTPIEGQPDDRHQSGMCWTKDGKTLFFISHKAQE